MRQIRTSGSMSGERKRKRWPGLRQRHEAKAAGPTTAPALMPPRRPSTLPRARHARGNDKECTCYIEVASLYCANFYSILSRKSSYKSPKVILSEVKNVAATIFAAVMIILSRMQQSRAAKEYRA